jgi:hypothetical protein
MYPLAILSATAIVGIIIDNLIVVVLPLIVLVLFPGLPLFFHLVIHLFVKLELHPDKVVVRDYVGSSIVRASRVQQMEYGDIAYIYYLGKEINVLETLRKKLKKYKLSPKENDYTKENLAGKYGVPADEFERFERDSRNILNDYTATGILMKLEEICRKYDVPKKTVKEIAKELEDDRNFNYEFVMARLEYYSVEPEDSDELRDEFSNVKTDFVRSFLLTKVNMGKYKKLSSYRGGVSAAATAHSSLVFSNKDGTEKIYLMHLHDLSRDGWQAVMEEVKIHNPNIAYLMRKSEYNNLFRLTN